MNEVIIKIQAHGAELSPDLIRRAINAYLLNPKMTDDKEPEKHACGVSCPEFSLSASAWYG